MDDAKKTDGIEAIEKKRKKPYLRGFHMVGAT